MDKQVRDTVWVVGIMLVSVLASSPLTVAEDKSSPSTDVADVESQIGLDQIVIRRPKANAGSVITPVADAGEIPVGTNEQTPPAPSTAAVTTTAAEKPLPGIAGIEISGRQVSQAHHSLKKMIETNSRLEEKNMDLEKQLSNIRGQRKIEVTRLEKLTKERDGYLDERNQYAQRNEEIRKQLEQVGAASNQLQKDITDLRTQLAEKEKTLRVMLAEPQPFKETSASTDEQVVMKAQEVFEMREMIKNLSVQIETKENEKKAALEEDQAKIATATKEWQAKLAELEQKLQDKQTELASVKKEPGVSPSVPEVEKAAPEATPATKTESAMTKTTEPTGVVAPGDLVEAARVIPPQATPAMPGVAGLGEDDVTKVTRSREKNLKQAAALLDQAVAKQRPSDISSGDAPSIAVLPSDAPAMQDRKKGLQVIAMVDVLDERNEKIKADEALVHYNMGNAFFQQGQFKRAADEYREAVLLKPQDANAHFNLAFVSLEYLHDAKTALEHFRQYLWLDPEAKDKALVQEKIIDAQMVLGAQLDSNLEKEVQAEDVRTFSR